MKISIEVSLEPGEEARVAEILRLLRDLATTFHIRDSTPSAHSPAIPSPAPAPQPVASVAPYAYSPQPVQIPSPAPQPPAPQPFVAYASVPAAPAYVQPVPVQQSAPVPEPAPAYTPPSFYDIITRIEADREGITAEEGARQIEEGFRIRGGPTEPVLLDFANAMIAALGEELKDNYKTRAGYILSLAHVPFELRMALRNNLVKMILQRLTISRPVDCNRQEFFAFAEAFAAVVHLELVGAHSAIKTLTNIVKKPENRAAAVTTIGKCIELALPQLGKVDEVEPGTMAALHAALNTINDPSLEYDMNYIRENLAPYGGPAALPAY